MDETQLYENILGITSPWFVDSIELKKSEGAVYVYLGTDEGGQLHCPQCGKSSPGYDKRERRWRHLDTCQYKTFVIAPVPRVECPDHGCVSIPVSWAEQRSRFTLLFETQVIDWLKDTSVSAVANRLDLSWNTIDGIMQRAVARGLARRASVSVKRIGVDETSFKKRHDYVTVVTNSEGQVVAVEDGREKASLKRFYDTLSDEQKSSIESISMDMSPAYQSVTLEEIPHARDVISFDKFHIAMYLNKAVDDVRKRERHAYPKEMKNSRYLWLYRECSLNNEQHMTLEALHTVALKTSRAWAIKELAMSLWDYVSRGWAEKAWMRWYSWAIRSRLQPVKKVAKMIKSNLWGILNAIVLKADNGMAESLNSKIKILKTKSRGFRNRERFKTSIFFHYGGLDLYPEMKTHSI